MKRFIYKKISEYSTQNIKENIILKKNEEVIYILFIDVAQKKTIDIQISLIKESSSVYLYILENGVEAQAIDLNIRVEHIAPNTFSRTSVRRVMRDGSTSFITDLIKIDKLATGSNAYFDEKTLLLGDNVLTKVIPSLEVIPNNIKASHASSTSGIREDELFYLESRGIDKEDAIRNISSGFLISKLFEIKDQVIQSQIIEKIRKDL